MRPMALLVSMAALCWAQKFEVASVKPAQPATNAMINSGRVHFGSDAVRFEASNASLHELISFAYGIKWDYVSAPDWIDNQYFAILASLPAGSTKEQVPAMMQKLLAERFKLAVHHDQKTERVYELTVNKNGTKLKPSTGGEPDRDCWLRAGQLFCRANTLEQFAAYLTNLANAGARMMARAPAGEVVERRVDRPVVDRTGISGVYDIDLQWMPPVGLGDDPPRPAPFPARDSPVKADSIFGAAEAMGLKLQAAQHAFDILVIDHVERVPTEN